MNFNEKLLKENYFNAALATIQEIVQIPSYAQSPTKTAPYGSGVAEVLDYVIKLAKSLGFKTYQDPNGKYGYVEYGDGAKTFAILGHLDVVPPGDLSRWKTPPFEPKIIEDILYGRGVLDDKGPTLIVLYCLKYLKDHNYQPLHKIRLIFGLTEETTWDSITTYMTTEGTPDFGFTPDGLFPLTYAEKAIVNLDINGPGDEQITLQGGDAYNVTCAFATTTGVNVQQLAEIAKQNHYQFEIKNNNLLINGKPAHGSRPADGINAGLQSLLALKALGHQHPLVQFVAEKLQEDTTWKQYFGQYDDESGSFTINVGMVTINKNASKLACNIRIPVHTDYQIIVEKIRELIQPYGLTLVIEHYDKPLYMAQDSPIVKKLMAIYQNVTGDKTAQPIAIGGGTYARSMPNCVAFGAIFDDKTSTEHTYNECIKLKELWQAMLIYLQAIATLGVIEKI